jgi:prepilin-type N-terminal cleavage/methylation domain-containing protein
MFATKKNGFTILELLVVISIIAIIMTLATGAAVKSIKQGREKRVDAMVTALNIALETYRTQNGQWPSKIIELRRQALNYNPPKETIELSGSDNKYVFTDLYKKQNSGMRYMDPAGFFTIYQGARKPLKDIPEASRQNLPLGYPDPDNTDKFDYFKVVVYVSTDEVRVSR